MTEERKGLAGGLDASTLEVLRACGEEASFADGDAVVHRGDPASSFYVVVAGLLEVVLVGDGGQRLSLTLLGPGATFGEMSVITGQPISADVVARGPARVLVCPGSSLRRAIDESSAIRNHVLSKLIGDLRRTTSDVWMFSQRSRALGGLIHRLVHTGPVVEDSVAMQQTVKRLDELAGRPGNVLIWGEAGSGKVFAARRLHESGPDPSAPFIAVDCRRLPAGESVRILFGVEDAVTTAPDRTDDLMLLGLIHLAYRGTLVLEHFDALEPTAQTALFRHLAGVSSTDSWRMSLRIVVTTREEPEALASSGRVTGDLASQFRWGVLKIPTLRDRKRDILPLARLFLEEHCRRTGAPGKRFSKAAQRTLVSFQYRHRNVDELRDAVESSALFADGDEIRAEHVYTGPKGQTRFVEYDLTEIGPIGRIVTGPLLAVIRWIILISFLGTAAVCIVGGNGAAGRAANLLGWAVWWPTLLLVFLWVGRAWCAVCPFSTAARLAGRLVGSKRAVPEWMRRYGAWVSALLFTLIIWTERVFDMPSNPANTGLIISGVLGLAVLFAVLFEREVWCRHLCPLGGLAAGLSSAAMVHLRARPEVCSAQCTTHECLKGSASARGCPVRHHPVYAHEGLYCKLCMECLRTCPHGATRLFLRPPLWSIWGLSDLDAGLVPLVLSVFGLAMVMLAGQTASTFTPVRLATGTALALGFAALVLRFLPRRLSTDEEPDPALLARISVALMVLAWGPLMACHLVHVPGLSSLALAARPGSSVSPFFPAGGVSLLTVLQVVAVLWASVASAFVLWRIGASLYSEGRAPLASGRRAVQAIHAGYTVLALLLVTGAIRP